MLAAQSAWWDAVNLGIAIISGLLAVAGGITTYVRARTAKAYMAIARADAAIERQRIRDLEAANLELMEEAVSPVFRLEDDDDVDEPYPDHDGTFTIHIGDATVGAVGVGHEFNREVEDRVSERLEAALKAIERAPLATTPEPLLPPPPDADKKSRPVWLIPAILVFIPSSANVIVNKIWPDNKPTDCIAYVNSLETLQKDFPNRQIDFAHLKTLYGSAVVDDCGPPAALFVDGPQSAPTSTAVASTPTT